MGYDFGVGREAPTFTLTAVDGSEIKLNQYRGDWFPVLAFVPTRSPGAPELLEQLSAAAGTLWGLRGQVIGICDADAEACAALAAKVPGLAFPLAPDDGSVALMYGARKQDGTARPMVVHHRPRRQDRLDRRRRRGLTAPALLAAFGKIVR